MSFSRIITNLKKIREVMVIKFEKIIFFEIMTIEQGTSWVNT